MNNLYFVCPDDNNPIGGIKILYRHVDILNRNGFQAAIVHHKKGFRCTWFENDTKIVYLPALNPDPFDFAVLPEIYGPKLAEMIPAAKKIIFNQNSYLTFKGYTYDPRDLTTPYFDPTVIAAMVVSEDSRHYLSYVFPNLKVFRIHNSVDDAMFQFRDLSRKKKTIAFMSRKNPDDARQVINILKFRGVLDGWDVAPIENRTEREVAEILEDSMIFLSFGYPEGCPAPPLEAMLCGCMVVGYHGNGGREAFQTEFAWPVEAADIIGFAREVEKVVQLAEVAPTDVVRRTIAARDFVRTEYSHEREKQDILQFWDEVMFEQGHDAIAEA